MQIRNLSHTREKRFLKESNTEGKQNFTEKRDGAAFQQVFSFWNSFFFFSRIIISNFTRIWKPVCVPRNRGENKIWFLFDPVKRFQIYCCLNFPLGFLGNQTGSRGYYCNLHNLLKFTECKGRAWNQGITYTRGELFIFMLIMVIIFFFFFSFSF